MTSTIARDSIVASVPLLDLDLDVREYSITLDDARSPYIEARLTCAAPDADDLDLLDPRDELRVVVTLGRDMVAPVAGTQTRTLDLYLHGRTYDAAEGTVELICRSDEAILIDDMLGGTEIDDSAEEFQTSLRDIINAVLADFGAELEPGDADADFTITTNATNLIPNPSFEVDISGWTASAGASTGSRQTTVARYGSASFRARATGTTAGLGCFLDASPIGPPYPILVTAGRTYTLSVWVYTSLSGKTADARLRWANASSNIGSDSVGASVPLTPGTWTRVSVTATAPAGATNVGVWTQASGGFVAGDDVYFDAFLLTEGDSVLSYFDGSAGDTDHYTLAWTGTAHASTSTRTRLDNRSPDVLKREPGEKTWDFLASLVDAAGLRLFCDEQRRWYLVDPASFTVPGSLRVSEGFNATAAAETIDLSAADRGVPGYAETVVVKYTWLEGGEPMTAYDAAGDPHGIGRFVEVNRPYPGPGAAETLLRKSQGKGRTLDLGALADLTATPGQNLVATMPGAPIQTGLVSSVEWSSDGTMRIGSRGLTDTPETAWSLAQGAWDDVTGIPWNEIDEEGE